jgi:CRP-like cAMP-binding protein
MLHFANILYLASYSVRDILWLRILTIVAILMLLPYYYYQPTPMIGAMVWNGLFAALNVVQIIFLLLERRPVQLDDRQSRIYRLVFRSLTPREFLKLISSASWRQAEPGDEIVHKGEALDRLILIGSGRVKCEISEARTVELNEGQFVGEMAYLTGGASTARVSAIEPTEYLVWPTAELERFLFAHPALSTLLQTVIGIDLVAKLKA